MSVFAGHDVSLNKYHYVFYSFSKSEPNTLKAQFYDSGQNLLGTQNISFSQRDIPAMLTFLENSESNPYALGNSPSGFRNMDIAFSGIYKKALKDSQQQSLMTYINKTFKNVYSNAVTVYDVKVNGSMKYVIDDVEQPNLLALRTGIYVFDQSDPSNSDHLLRFRNLSDSTTPYTTNVTHEGTPGTPNSYSIIDVTQDTPDLEYYCEVHTGSMYGEFKTLTDLTSYRVKVIDNILGDPVFALSPPGTDEYYNQIDVSFGAGDKLLFDISQLGESYSLVFGTEVDVSSTIQNQYFNQAGDVIVLSIPSDYSGNSLKYFEDTTAGMGYVVPSGTGSYIYQLVQSDFRNTSVLGDWGPSSTDTYVYNYTLTGNTDYTFVNGTYDISQSDYDTQADYHKYLHRVVSSNTSNGDGQHGYDWHTSASYNTSTGEADGTITTTTNTSTTYTGSWIQMKLPYGLNIKQISIDKRYSYTTANPKNAHLLGSNDDGVTFYHIADITLNQTGLENLNITIPSTAVYNLIRMVVSTTYASPQGYCHIDYWSLVGDVYQYQYVIQEPITKIVDVSNEVFYIDGSANPQLTFTSGETYVFDLSHNSNTGNTLVLGTVPDSSTNLIDYQTIVGTPGQPGAYTSFTASGETVFYYSFETPDMGYEPPTYTVKTELNVLGDTVFSIQKPDENVFYTQPDLSFGAGFFGLFNVSQLGESYSLVFGTEVDVSSTIQNQYFNQAGDVIVLSIPSDYSGNSLKYFDASTNKMSYSPYDLGQSDYIHYYTFNAGDISDNYTVKDTVTNTYDISASIVNYNSSVEISNNAVILPSSSNVTYFEKLLDQSTSGTITFTYRPLAPPSSAESWHLIFRQTKISATDYLWSVDPADNALNPDDPTNDNFSVLNTMNGTDAYKFGNYYLLRYVDPVNSRSIEFIQTSNFVTTYNSVTGYVELDKTNTTITSFTGLAGSSNTTDTWYDGKNPNSDWWHALAVKTWFGNGIPAFNDDNGTSQIELYAYSVAP